MDRRRLDVRDSLAQYVLVARMSAGAVTLVALVGGPRWRLSLLTALVVLVGFNYVGLRHWSMLRDDLHLEDKPIYLVLDAALGSALLAAVGVGSPMVLYLVGTGLLGGLVFRVRLALSVGAVVTVAYLVTLFAHLGSEPGVRDVHTMLTLPALLLGSGAGGVAAQRLLVRQARATSEISALRELAAVHEERLRMARDLHDSVTKNLHGLWLLSAGIGAALNRGDVETARSCADAVGTTAKRLADESRGVIRGLRDDSGVALDEELAVAVRRAVSGHALRVDLDLDDVEDCDGDVRHEVLAIALEAVHNAVKHARAGALSVTLREAPDGTLHLQVRDDGQGFVCRSRQSRVVRPGHFGLVGIEERAARVGGRVQVRSGPGEGTRVELMVPRRGLPPDDGGGTVTEAVGAGPGRS